MVCLSNIGTTNFDGFVVPVGKERRDHLHVDTYLSRLTGGPEGILQLDQNQ